MDIVKLRKDYGEAVDALEPLAEAGGEPYDAAMGKVKSLKGQIDRALELETIKAAGAKDLPKADTVPATAKAPLVKGANVARCFMALAANKGNTRDAAEYARKHWGESDDNVVAKNLLASVGSSGGFLVPEDFRNELIELLRPQSVIYASSPRIIEMPNGNVTIPGLASGVSANYVGEAQPITPSTQTFRAVTLVAKKLAALIPISNDMLRYPTLSTDQFVRDDMIASIATITDQTLLRGPGTQFSPKGLLGWINDVSSTNVITANTTVNLANVTQDLGKLDLAIENSNIPWVRPAYIMSPRSKIFLMNMRDGNGNIAFPEMAGGNLRGKPFRTTTSVPDNIGGSSNGSEVYLVEWSQFIVGEAMSLEIATVDGAAYWNGSATVSAFSQDQTVMRAITAHDSAMRQPRSAAMLNDVRWF